MNNYEIEAMMKKDFSPEMLRELASQPMVNVQRMQKADRIIVEDSLLDYLQEFFNGNFDGQPMPELFEEYVVEWTTQGESIDLFVKFSKEFSKWIFVDVWVGSTYIGKLLYPNVVLDDSDRNEEGNFYTFTPFLSRFSFEPKILNQLIPAVKDVFTYATLFTAANIDDPKQYKEKFSKEEKREFRKKKKNSRKNSEKVFDANERKKVFVPSHHKRIYTLKETEASDAKVRNYVLSRWSVRGYSYIRNGKVVNVKEHLAYRHFPNKGLKKLEGRDYILREPKNN